MKRPAGRIWMDTFFARKTMDRVPNEDLAGATMVFTGGTDGMGRVAVERFAEMGADIHLLGRSATKTENVVNELRGAGHKGRLSVIQCDLMDLEGVRRAASEVLDRCERIDYLINCAGVNFAERTLSPDGHEMNFAVNYLGPFLLTELLLERIRATPGSRIVHLTSATQEVAKLRLDDLHLETSPWSMMASYAQAKLCIIMHGRDVAARLEGADSSIICLNPGYVRSNLARHRKGFERMFTQLFGGLAAPTWVGGERIVASALEAGYADASGQFVHEDMLLAPNPQALDEAKVARLMRVSREMTGLQETPKESPA